MAGHGKRMKATHNAVAARRQKVVEMMLGHHTQQEIAEACSVSEATISKDVKAIKEEWQTRRQESMEAWIGEELAKLDAVERAIMQRIIEGDDQAIDRLVKVMDRRAKLLGLDAHALSSNNADAAKLQIFHVVDGLRQAYADRNPDG